MSGYERGYESVHENGHESDYESGLHLDGCAHDIDDHGDAHVQSHGDLGHADVDAFVCDGCECDYCRPGVDHRPAVLLGRSQHLAHPAGQHMKSLSSSCVARTQKPLDVWPLQKEEQVGA